MKVDGEMFCFFHSKDERAVPPHVISIDDDR